MYNPNTNLGNGFFAMRKIIVGTSLILIAFLNGCASVPMATVENDTARKTFPSPSPDTAGLYIYRNTTLGGSLKKDLFIDGVRVAESAPMTYFYFEVEDGMRKLSTESEFSPNDLIVDVEEGNNYFVRQSIRLGLFVGGADLELVSEEEGKKGVLECKLANNVYGNVPVNTVGVKTPVPSNQPVPRALEYTGQAEEEINTQTYDQNLWDKALVETGGDEAKRRARYIELRAKQLYIAQIDLAGSYTSAITYNQDVDRSKFRAHFGKLPNIVIDIQQKDEVITGVMSGDRSGEIEGLIEGNKVTFNYFMKVPDSSYKEGHGTWMIGDDLSTLNGTWRGDAPYNSYAGKWNLTKIE